MTSGIKIEPMAGFPLYAGLIQRPDLKAYTLRYHAPYAIGNTKGFDTGTDRTLRIDYEAFLHTLHVPPCNAVFLAAPYVKVTVKEEATDLYLRRLGMAKVSLTIDGDRTFRDFPLRHLLAVPKDRRLREYPFDLDPGLSFQAGPMNEDGNIVDEPGYGIFIPNGAVLRMTIDDIPGGVGRIDFEAGCVAAEYTTEKMPGPKEWSPRGYEGYLKKRMVK